MEEGFIQTIMSPDEFGRVDVFSSMISLQDFFSNRTLSTPAPAVGRGRHGSVRAAAHGGAGPANASLAESWSSDAKAKDRTKTVAVGLVMCLNVGIDPPDVVKVTRACGRGRSDLPSFGGLPVHAAVATLRLGWRLGGQLTRCWSCFVLTAVTAVPSLLCCWVWAGDYAWRTRERRDDWSCRCRR